MTQCKGNTRLQKVVAMALYIKFILGRSSMMQNFTINKLHEKTGISATTLKKYLPILKQLGFLHYDKQNIIFHKMCSHSKMRNICVDKFCFDSFKDTYNSLRAFIALSIQSHKDFIKRTLQTLAEPKSLDEFRKARRYVKGLVKHGIIDGMFAKYKEYGLSLKRISLDLGSCVRTTQRIMQYAIKHKWCKKQRNFEQIFAYGVNYRDVHWSTFTTKNNIYVIHPNTYTLNDDIALYLTPTLVVTY